MVPILLAMLCILAVFLPSFLMEGAARSLFVPLAISVGFAMITAFILSITFVPVLSIWILKAHAKAHEGAKPSRRACSPLPASGAGSSRLSRWHWLDAGW